MFAVLAVPLLLSVGVAIDFGRVHVATGAVQNIVDSAAMAGATVFSDESREQMAAAVARHYLDKGAATLPATIEIGSSAVTTQPEEGCAGNAAERITVSATATISTTFMSIAIPSVTVNVSATAAHPLVEFYLDVRHLNFGAADKVALWWYRVPPDGQPPTPANLELIIDNVTSGGLTAVKACVGPDQKIGFAFSDSVSGKYPCAYGSNAYGGICPNTYYYYSTLSPPSRNAYPTWNYNSALQIVDVAADGSHPPPVTGVSLPINQPFNSVAATGSVSCNDLNGRSIYLYWNDMGGIIDDLDYDDGQISFGCSTAETGSVHLVK